LFDDEVLPIRGEDDIVTARGRARERAKALGFGMVDQSRIATAVSELTRNVLRYATDGRGEATLRPLQGPGARVGLEVVVADDGPGIANLSEAMRDGVTGGQGLGMGLPGTKRLMDEMEVDTGPGRGTIITIRKWRR